MKLKSNKAVFIATFIIIIWLIMPYNSKAKSIKTSYTSSSSKNRNKPYKVYKTVSENGKIYVGESRNVNKRLQQHANGHGSAATKKYVPDHAIVLNNFNTREEAKRFENKVVKIEKIKHGKDNVRGGSHTSTKKY